MPHKLGIVYFPRVLFCFFDRCFWGELESLRNTIFEGCRFRNEDSIVSMSDDSTHRIKIIRNDTFSTCHSLEIHKSKCICLRWKHKNISASIYLSKISAFFDPKKMRLRKLCFEFFTIRPISYDHFFVSI